MLDDDDVRIEPRRSLLLSAMLSIVLVMIPTFGLLYWFAIPRGQAGYVAIAQALVIGAALIILLRQLTVDTVVTHNELRGKGIFSPTVRVPFEKIATVDLIPTYLGQSADPIFQLLVRDAEGKRLFRLRGNYWKPGDLRKVAAALPVTATISKEPMSLKEFFDAYRGAAYWFENRRAVKTAIFVAVAVVCLGVAFGAMYLLQMPVLG